ncbi:hypothetical protein NL676_016988 [Syzygium grande]|nr:hypothetical protein NL676_016988 [Syzygium grande]
MVFKFATFDPAQDPNDFNPAFPPTPSSSPSATLCQPCEYTCTFTRAIVSRLVAAGASLVLRAPAFEIDGHEIRDRSAEMPFHSINSDVCPAFQRRQLKEFTLKELKVATGNFSNKNLIGGGGFGQVYKGRLADGTLVAVKDPKKNKLKKNSRGSCERAVPSACLKVVHLDIKAANITLDEEFEPHIGDFGMAKFIHRRYGGHSVDCIEKAPVLPRDKFKARFDSEYSEVTTAVRGTIGHIAPEYLSTGKCSVKTDVFAFGVMLLELLTGQRAFDLARLANDDDVMLLDWVKVRLVKRRWDIIVDSDLQSAYDEEEIEKVTQLALLCTQSNPIKRPSMAQVLQILGGHSIEERWNEYKLELKQDIDNPHTDWTVADSTSHLRPDELSGPR